VQQLLEGADLGSLGADATSAVALHEYADHLQKGLGNLHELLVTTYFQMEPWPAATAPVPTVLSRV
jgi:hypothetical protein